MQNQSVIEYIKRLYKSSGAVGKLIAINVVVHFGFGIADTIERLFVHPELMESQIDGAVLGLKSMWLAAPSDPALLLYKPWTLVTYMFVHLDFMHLLGNMLVLYFLGRLFVQFFGEKRILSTYVLAGLFAYFIHSSSFLLIPAYKLAGGGIVLGASGAVMGIFMATVFYKPMLKIHLFGLIQMPIIVLGLVYIIFDLRGLAAGGNVAHLAHLGGGIFGALSIINVNSPKNFMNRLEKWFSNFKWPSFQRKPKMKVYKNEARSMNDDEYNSSKQDHQLRVDAILDKISKKGYEGLSKEEKDILFNESKRK